MSTSGYPSNDRAGLHSDCVDLSSRFVEALVVVKKCNV